MDGNGQHWWALGALGMVRNAVPESVRSVVTEVVKYIVVAAIGGAAATFFIAQENMRLNAQQERRLEKIDGEHARLFENVERRLQSIVDKSDKDDEKWRTELRAEIKELKDDLKDINGQIRNVHARINAMTAPVTWPQRQK